MEFKVGDLVRFKNDGTNYDLINRSKVVFNKTYKIIKVGDIGIIIIVDSEENNSGWFSYRFEKVTREMKLRRILK